MIGIHVTVPIACFRKGLAREYLETEPLPPPSTCYGFLLSLVGEVDRRRHVGVHVCPVLIDTPGHGVVLRTLWRIKNLGTAEFPVHPGQNPPAHYPRKAREKGGNVTPGYQEVLSGIRLLMWLDSSQEQHKAELLEDRVQQALDPARRNAITRFGGLSLGESTHLVDEVSRFQPDETRAGEYFLLAERGRMTLPVWVDHVGSAGTRYVTGDLVNRALVPPEVNDMPQIVPPNT